MKKIPGIFALSLGLFIMFPAAAAPVYEYNPGFFESTWQIDCTSVVEKKTAELVADYAQIRKFSFLPTYGGDDEDAPVRGYEGWVSFKNCTGNLVIMMNKTCSIINVYTTNKCLIDGVKNY